MKPIEELNVSPWPWKVECNECYVDGIVDADGESVVTTDSGFYNPELNDARLIAAAPDMYEALYDAERELCIVAPMSRCLDKIRKALAKAAGEEN